jgi:NAD(P)-dependent dehydrogenase (short-subunit alcohol dehydrogenase family)
MRLSDMVAIVTGGGGLGEGIGLCLARAGAQIVVSDLSLENAEKVSEKIRDRQSNGRENN